MVTTGVSTDGPSGTGWISAIVSTSPGSRSAPVDSVKGTTDDAVGSTGLTVSMGKISTGPIVSGTKEGLTTVGVPPTRTPGPSPSGTYPVAPPDPRPVLIPRPPKNTPALPYFKILSATVVCSTLLITSGGQVPACLQVW